MRRGEIWSLAGGGEFLSKPRPAIILQDDFIDDLTTITVCPLTTNWEHGAEMRVPVEASERNGLDSRSRIMVDRITTVLKSRLGSKIGELSDEEMDRLNRAIVVFPGLETSRDDD